MPGDYKFTVSATDSSTGTGPYSGSRAYAMHINPGYPVISPASLPQAKVGAAFSASLCAANGVAPYSYAVTAGALPAGVGLSSSCQFSVTPTEAGVFAFTVSSTDSAGGAGPYTGTIDYTLTVAAPTLALTPESVTPGTVGVAYSRTLSASGGTAPYAYAVTAGALPTGLSLGGATGVVSGTPTAGGTFAFTVTATDSSTGTGAPFTVSRAYSLTINAPIVQITPAVLPAGRQTVAYSQSLSATGGNAPYSFAVTAGALLYGGLALLVLRPLRRVTRSMERFAADPESEAETPSDRHDEIGRVERELARMQEEVRQSLRSRARLVALGEAVEIGRAHV